MELLGDLTKLRSREEKVLESTSNIRFVGLDCYIFFVNDFCKVRLIFIISIRVLIEGIRQHSEAYWVTS